MNANTQMSDENPADGRSDSNGELDLPWHIGFSDEVAGNLCSGTYQPDLIRYSVYNICGQSGKVQAFATSFAAAKLIVDSVNGTKDTEYRIYGPRWNERTCAIGREVVLSHGYGKQRRLRGVVVGFEASHAPTKTEAWRKCYGESDSFVGKAACIRVALMGPNV